MCCQHSLFLVFLWETESIDLSRMYCIFWTDFFITLLDMILKWFQCSKVSSRMVPSPHTHILVIKFCKSKYDRTDILPNFSKLLFWFCVLEQSQELCQHLSSEPRQAIINSHSEIYSEKTRKSTVSFYRLIFY